MRTEKKAKSRQNGLEKTTIPPALKKAAITKKAEQSGLSPLDVILEIMQQAYANDDQDLALAAAKLAAPYVHVRAMEAQGSKSDPVKMIITWMDHKKETLPKGK